MAKVTTNAKVANAKAAKKEPLKILGYSLIELTYLTVIITVVHTVLGYLL